MIWQIYALLSLFGVAGIHIFMKALSLDGVSALIINFYVFTFTAICFFIAALVQKDDFTIITKSSLFYFPLVIAAIFANYFFVKAVETAPNAGYVTAIGAGSIFVVVFVSYLFLDGTMNFYKILGGILIAGGIALISLSK